ncbi:ATP-binding protein [Blautia massiliensis]|mgnify:CR=1 FL=1|uniref:ATP-binding protein n=2 Tax=Bacillota TaxID=1239 RepID=UPI00156FD2A4|nr:MULTISPECIES: ATP-binding protein [Blautia]MCC2724326.1 ATP-binding protein [Blautia sp. MSK22_86]NSF58396.1 ATP-binding protein [Blautia massiliensis (ex Durand et al. 2017)]NSK73740.1 ATP-binding protein [Blautia massiliensis (ex Durand et al. 2017)]
MFKINPYRPGAGLMPVYIAGRDEDIQNVDQMFEALTLNIPTQSIIFSGLRGVGKTVLINKLQSIAEDRGIFCKHIEIEERNDFISQIAECSQSFLRKVSTKEKFRHLVQKPLEAIKSLVVSFNPGENIFSLSMQDRDLYLSNNLTQSLTDVFTTIGETAQKTETPICFFIDEIQYMKQNQLGSLIAALHRTNQLGYPVMIVGAGLPKIYKMLSDEKSYSERLFVYKQVDSLTYEQSKKAIEEPVRKFHVSYTENAIKKIVEITKGYPFFIQQLCQIVYKRTDSSVIEYSDVDQGIDEFLKMLDDGFFRSRYERCAESDKKFIFAMVKCGELPCTISNVAKNLHKSVSSISTTRAQLISKGIIYPVRYKELDFTVPEFSGFIQRLDEYKQWDEN